MWKIKKGDYGYIKSKKMRQLFFTFLMAAIGLFMYGTGYLVNDMRPSKVCLILAILMVLPGAKFFVGFMVLFPYRSPDRKLYDELSALVPEGIFWSDLVITSEEKVMNLDFMYIGKEHVLALIGKDGQNIGYIQSYLTKGVRNRSDRDTVKVCATGKEFKKLVSNLKGREADPETEKEVIAYLKSLIV